MHDHLGDEGQNEVSAEANGPVEVGPVVPVLEGLEDVAVKIDVTVEVHLVEGLHGDLALAVVLELVGAVLEGEVVLDGAARQLDLLILAGAHGRGRHPETGEDGKGGEEAEENGGLATATDLP